MGEMGVKTRARVPFPRAVSNTDGSFGSVGSPDIRLCLHSNSIRLHSVSILDAKNKHYHLANIIIKDLARQHELNLIHVIYNVL